LIENGKIGEIIELVKDNVVDNVWRWAKSSPSIIVLTAENL